MLCVCSYQVGKKEEDTNETLVLSFLLSQGKMLVLDVHMWVAHSTTSRWKIVICIHAKTHKYSLL